jgi:heme exporter protein CcmD
MPNVLQALKPLLAMGGYGLFVWSAFLLTGFVLAALLVISYRSLRNRQATLAELRQQFDPEGKPPHAA